MAHTWLTAPALAKTELLTALNSKVRLNLHNKRFNMRGTQVKSITVYYLRALGNEPSHHQHFFDVAAELHSLHLGRQVASNRLVIGSCRTASAKEAATHTLPGMCLSCPQLDFKNGGSGDECVSPNVEERDQ